MRGKREERRYNNYLNNYVMIAWDMLQKKMQKLNLSEAE